ncbi:stress protein [Luteolibacter algae]|uniref:Stress protein n=1 Tax=Luteolibacter algae TaxID=454151 RepID=A0ABW5D8U3_9BACT
MIKSQLGALMPSVRFAAAISVVSAGFFLGLGATAGAQDMKNRAEPVGSAATSGNTVTVIAHEKDGRHFVFAGGDGGRLNSFSLSGEGKLLPLETLDLWKGKGPSRGLVAAVIEGNDYLFLGNKGGNAIEVFRIGGDGGLERVSVTHDTDSTFLGSVITLQVVHFDTGSYLFAGGLEETPGVSSFRISSDGQLHHVQSMKDTDEMFTDGIIGMSTQRVGGATYVFVDGFHDNGISSFRVTDDGKFTNVSNIGDDGELFLNGAYPLTSVKLGDETYVVVGHRHHSYYKRKGFIKEENPHYHGDGVSVFKVDREGKLVPHMALRDDDSLRLKGQTRIELMKLDEGRALVAVASREEQAIQLCELGADGVLKPGKIIETGFEIYNGMTSVEIGGTRFLLAGPLKGKGLYSYAFD